MVSVCVSSLLAMTNHDKTEAQHILDHVRSLVGQEFPEQAAKMQPASSPAERGLPALSLDLPNGHNLLIAIDRDMDGKLGIVADIIDAEEEPYNNVDGYNPENIARFLTRYFHELRTEGVDI